MPNIKVYNQQGAAVRDLMLDESVFGAEVNVPLIHQVVVAQMANARQGTKSTLTRTEVRGGGKKPWRQKHTGKARQGSIRAPQWIKGGVVFAPKPRDFDQKINKRMKAAALCAAFSSKVADNELIVLDALSVGGKTKEMKAVLDALQTKKSVLLVLDGANDLAVRAGRNIPGLKTIPSELINVLDIMSAEKVVLLSGAVTKLETAYKTAEV